MQFLFVTGRQLCRWVVALLCLILWSQSASAESRVDWERGLLIATAGAPADLRAPNTALARVKAERVAINRCQDILRRAAGDVITASGKTVGKRLGNDFEQARLSVIPLGADQGSDGSVVVRMALPIDALRAELFGADTPLAAESASSPLFVDARSTKLRPSVGLGLAAGGTAYRGPVLYFVDESRARKDARLGKDAILVPASKMKNGVLSIAKKGVAERFAGSPLVVVLYSETP